MKLINIILLLQVSSICMFCMLSCTKEKETKIEKKDFVWSMRLVKKERIQELKSNEWKLKNIYVRNTTTTIVNEKDRIRFEDIDNSTMKFKKDKVYINSKLVGTVDYKNELFFINDIDTLTNKYFISKLKNNRLVLENDVGYYLNNKLIKRFTIELFFEKDSLNLSAPSESRKYQ